MISISFKGDIQPSTVDDALLPTDGGISFSVSADSPSINRNDVRVVSLGGAISVRIDGVAKSELSSNTEQNIIDAVPTDYIQTREVEQS